MNRSECEHAWQLEYIQYGRYLGRGRDRYQEMTHVRKCTKCGAKQRESDRYFGRDREPGRRVYFGKDGGVLF
jgi:hypothetical protein